MERIQPVSRFLEVQKYSDFEIPWWVRAGIFGFPGNTQFGDGSSLVSILPQASALLDIGSQTKPIRTAWLVGAGATMAPLNVAQGAAPSSPIDGDVWHDSTRDTLQMYVGAIKHTVGGTLFNSTANAATTAGGSAAELTLIGTGVGTMTIPSSLLIAGKKLRFHASGLYSTKAAAVGTLTFRLKHGVTTFISQVQTPSASLTNQGWTFDLELTVRSSTTVVGNGLVQLFTTATAITPWYFGIGTGTATVAAAAWDFTHQWATSDASNIVTCTDFSMEALN